MDASHDLLVNHHAGHPGFSGLTGLLAAITMLASGRARGRLAADLAGVTESDHVVDIGCGPGGAVRAAAKRGCQATGIDPAPVMLRLARIATRKNRRVTWLPGSAEDLPLPDRSATVLWSLATVHHWQDVAAALAQAHRVLAPGGRFLAIERRVSPGATGLASHGWTDEQGASFATQCGAGGFDDVRVERRRLGRRTIWAIRAVRR